MNFFSLQATTVDRCVISIAVIVTRRSGQFLQIWASFFISAKFGLSFICTLNIAAFVWNKRCCLYRVQTVWVIGIILAKFVTFLTGIIIEFCSHLLFSDRPEFQWEFFKNLMVKAFFWLEFQSEFLKNSVVTCYFLTGILHDNLKSRQPRNYSGILQNSKAKKIYLGSSYRLIIFRKSFLFTMLSKELNEKFTF